MSRILIIDDNELVSKLLYETLTANGYEVYTASDANQGFAMAQKQQPDLILLDIVLPDVNGLQLCKAFRGLPATREIPIILVTGTASSIPEKVKGLQAGADDYILKPFENDELLERIRAVLRRSQARPAQPDQTAPMSANHETRSHAPEVVQKTKSITAGLLSVREAIPQALWAPGELPKDLPPMALFYTVSLVALIATGLALAPGSAIPPILACVMAVTVWTFLVSALTVTASISGLPLKWKEAASLLSLAALPFLLKLLGACAFSAWTTLSPFLFTASPALAWPTAPAWISRLDFFEIWTAVLLGVLLSKRPGSSTLKASLITLLVWVLAVLAAVGLLHVGKMS